MLSSGMITPPFFIFPGNFTHSCKTENVVACNLQPATCSVAANRLSHIQIQGGSDKSGIFFFLLSNDTAQLKIIRFD
jgi:hypothetical protein